MYRSVPPTRSGRVHAHSRTQYGALFRLFRDLAEDAGVHLHFGTRAVSVDPWQGTVTCQDGRQLTADVIIGADGTESLVRPLVLGPTAPPPEYDNIFTVWYVPAFQVRVAPLTRLYTALSHPPTWPGRIQI